MISTAAACVVLWKRASAVRWRWFWIGAAVWTAGVVLKNVFSAIANKDALSWLNSHLPHWGYPAAASLYIGLLTGIFGIGTAFFAARRWPAMTFSADRAIAVGLGAGAFEALLMGLSPLITGIIVVTGNFKPDPHTYQELLKSLAIPAYVLIGTVERIIVILCHTASRGLVLLAVARGRMQSFWWAFLLMTGLDAVVGWTYFSGFMKTRSEWWVELMILPFGILSVYVIVRLLKRWPSEGTGPEKTPFVPELEKKPGL